MSRNVRRLLFAVFLIFLSQSLVAVLIPLDARSIGLEASIVGILVALPQAAGLFLDIPLAAWSDVVGRKLPVIVGAGLGALAAIMFAVGVSPLILAAGALVFGLSISLSGGASIAFVTEAAPRDDHARIQGLNGSVQGLSILAGATGAGFLVQAVGPRTSFWPLLLVLVAVGGISLGLQERPRTRSNPSAVSWLRRLAGRYMRVVELIQKEPAIRMAGASSLLYQFQLLTLENSFLPLYLITVRHFSGVVVGLLLAVRSLVGVALSAIFGKIFDRYGLVQPIVIGNVLGLTGVLLVAIVANPFGLTIPFALMGAGIAFGPATANLLVTSATSEAERAIGFSANSLIGRIGGLAFPLLIGVSIQAGGYPWMFVAAAALGAATLGVLWVCARSLGSWEDRAHLVGV